MILISKPDFQEFVEGFLATWTRQNPIEVANYYTEDVEYRDPSIDQMIRGREAFIAYLEKLFAHNTMKWHPRDCIPFATERGGLLLWTVEFDFPSRPSLSIDGMCYVFLDENNLAKWNEVHFDRSSLFKHLS